MTILTLRNQGRFRLVRAGHRAREFKSCREARNGCAKQHLGSPIEEIGRGGKRAERQRSPPSLMRGLVGGRVTGIFLNASRPRAVIETVASRRFISAKFRISALSSV